MNLGTARTRDALYASSLSAGASIVSAVLGWCSLLIVARWASPSTYVAVAVAWAAYYAVAGSVNGLQLEVTRWIVVRDQSRADGDLPESDGAGWGLLHVAVLVGCMSGIVVLVSYPLWQASLDAGWSVALVLALGALTLTGLIVVLGLLAAQRRWLAAAGLLLADSLVRLAATVLAVAFADALPWYALAIVSGSLTWVPMLVVSRDRLSSADWLTHVPGLLRRVTTTIASTSGASVLIAGLPWLYAATSAGVEGELSAGLIAGIVLFRSPVLVFAQGVRPIVLRELADAGANASRHIRLASLVYVIAALVSSVAAFGVGPALLRATFGDPYVVSHTQAAGLALSAVVLAYAAHVSVALVAVDQHQRATEGWLFAVLATVLLLVLPLDGATRLLLAAVGGPLSGVAYLGIAWVRVDGRREAES